MRASDPRTGRQSSRSGEGGVQIKKPLKIIGFSIVQTRCDENASHWWLNSRVSVMFCVAGFRPGRRRTLGDEPFRDAHEERGAIYSV
jgi:hypothetical protein